MAQIYNQSWIDKVKDSCDIVDVIGRYVPLKQKGRTFWGNCPFHHENEPSFAVSQERQFFNCFGCHEGGNVITFISKYESLSFIESLKLLAKMNNIELPENLDDEYIKKNLETKKKILDINLKCARFYNQILMSEEGRPAREYLYKRGLTDNIITRFGMGYSPDFKKVVGFLGEQKIPMEDALRAGIVGKTINKFSQSGENRYYDFFAQRIVFPIISSMGEVLGFSARVITKEYVGGKYKNSPDSIVFNKSNIVYAINLLKRASQRQHLEYAIICEGQMDVIALNQCGFENVVACMGTALTKNHAREIKRYVDKVIVCFDGDGAGQKATNRSLDILENEGLKVFVVSLPENLDPDEYTKKYGREKFVELLDNARPKNDYKFGVIRAKYNLKDNNQKTEFVKEVLEFVKGLSTHTEQEIFLRQIQTETKIPVETLKMDMKNPGEKQKQQPEVDILTTNTAYNDALLFVFSSYLNKKEYSKELDEIRVLDNGFYSLLLTYIREYGHLNSDIFEVLESKFGTQLIEPLRNYNFTAIENCEKYYRDCMRLIHLEVLESEYKMLTENIGTIQDSVQKRENLIKLDKILNEIQRIKMEE